LESGFAIAVLGLAISDRGSIGLPFAVRVVVPILLAIPAIYTFYSVARFFGFSRAMGIDHFDPEYKNAPLVKEGIFKWTSNSMYVFGFFIFWVIAFAFASRAALVVAGFSHAYIWVHFFCTERPDMELIYGEK
jgi:protein-S-isoprenylcysteine O-methyltransferase Ste14